eukprot:Lithocolla_globosa_v1_NODE_3039_length_1784_cov_93.872180.p1 type:complete len:318 gc:universal NODE_3039_length_1784_cov_93.872180:207-1160(+)
MVLVLQPWVNPIPITRAWCLWEIKSCIDMGCGFEICLPPSERLDLENSLNESFTVFDKALAGIDAEKAQATLETDRVMIFNAIEQSIGFQGINKLLKGFLRDWLLRTIFSLVSENEKKLQQIINRENQETENENDEKAIKNDHQENQNKTKREIKIGLAELKFNVAVIADTYYSRYSEAEKLFQQVVELQKELWGEQSEQVTRVTLSLSLMKQKAGETEKALALIDQIDLENDQIPPGIRVQALINKGSFLNSVGKYQECRQVYERALDFFKNYDDKVMNNDEGMQRLMLDANYSRLLFDVFGEVGKKCRGTQVAVW